MKPLTWPRMAYLFLVGVLVIFAMELTLWLSGIRPAEEGLDVLIFNSLLEFNVGIPVLYIVWNFIKQARTTPSVPSVTLPAWMGTAFEGMSVSPAEPVAGLTGMSAAIEITRATVNSCVTGISLTPTPFPRYHRGCLGIP